MTARWDLGLSEFSDASPSCRLGQFEQERIDGDRVVYVSGARVAEWLAAQPNRLSEHRTRELAAAVRELPRDSADRT
jgi:hypothetical protein